MVAAAALLGGCGEDPTVDTSAQPAPDTTSTSLAGRTYTSDLTTSDGYRYTVTMVVGPRTTTGAADECPGTPAPGKFFLPVTLTVANQATDRPAPFPPLRIELATEPGSRPGQVMVRDPSGACTFAPRVPSIGPGASVEFKGTTPPIDETAAPGAAGRIEVRMSESAFSLAAPVP